MVSGCGRKSLVLRGDATPSLRVAHFVIHDVLWVLSSVINESAIVLVQLSARLGLITCYKRGFLGAKHCILSGGLYGVFIYTALHVLDPTSPVSPVAVLHSHPYRL